MSEATTLDDLAIMYATYRELTQGDCALVRAFAHWLTLPGGPEVVERARVAAGAGDPQEDYINEVRRAFGKRWPYEVTAQLWDALRAAMLDVWRVGAVRPTPRAAPSDAAVKKAAGWLADKIFPRAKRESIARIMLQDAYAVDFPAGAGAPGTPPEGELERLRTFAQRVDSGDLHYAPAIQDAAREARTGVCAMCGGSGWYAYGPTEEPEQRQCERCGGSGRPASVSAGGGLTVETLAALLRELYKARSRHTGSTIWSNVTDAEWLLPRLSAASPAAAPQEEHLG